MPFSQSLISEPRREQFSQIVDTLAASKTYQRVSGYPDMTKEVYRAMAGYTTAGALELSEEDNIRYEYTKSVMFAACMDLIFHKVPAFFLDPRFALAIDKTDLDLSVRASKLVMPYDAMLFVFNENTCSFSNGKVMYVLAYHHHEESTAVKTMKEKVYSGGIKREFKIRESYHFFVCSDVILDTHGRQFSQADRCLYADEEMYTIDDLFHPELDGRNNDESVASCKACRVAVGAIMAMTCRPELLTKEIIHHWQHKDPSKRGNVAFWSPNIIGNGYQISGGHGNGTHASPRMHWRRGHFRNQACGAGRKDHHQIWLEPMLVAAVKEVKDAK